MDGLSDVSFTVQIFFYSFKRSDRTSYIDDNPMPCLNWASLAFFKDKFLTVKVKLHIKSSLCFIRSW